MRMHKGAVALAALLALGTAAAHADMPKGTPSFEQMAGYAGPDRDQKLLAAAKAEGGELSVYHVYPALTKVVAAFSKKYASCATARFRRSLRSAAAFARPLVFWNFGIAIAARMPMITTTIRSSMSVKPVRVRGIGGS